MESAERTPRLSHLWRETGSEHPVRLTEKPGRTSECAPAPPGRIETREEAAVRGPVWLRNPFKSLFGTTRREQYVERYVLREHRKGRSFLEILEDPYVRAWSTPDERSRLLERPDVVAAVGEQAIADLRSAVAAAHGPTIAVLRRRAERNGA
jgi:hypothetical protein